MSLEAGLNKMNLQELQNLASHVFVTQAGLSKRELVFYIQARLGATRIPRTNTNTQTNTQTNTHTNKQTDTTAIRDGPPMTPLTFPAKQPKAKTKAKTRTKDLVEHAIALIAEMRAGAAASSTASSSAAAMATMEKEVSMVDDSEGEGKAGTDDSEGEGKAGSDDEEGKEDDEEDKEVAEEDKDNDEVGTQKNMNIKQQKQHKHKPKLTVGFECPRQDVLGKDNFHDRREDQHHGLYQGQDSTAEEHPHR
jgi:hypothetical protein